MRKTIISAVVGLSLMTTAMVAGTEQADAHPALIFGIVAWKFVAIAATAVVTGIILDRAMSRNGNPYLVACPVHRRWDGTTFTRRNCT